MEVVVVAGSHSLLSPLRLPLPDSSVLADPPRTKPKDRLARPTTTRTWRPVAKHTATTRFRMMRQGGKNKDDEGGGETRPVGRRKRARGEGRGARRQEQQRHGKRGENQDKRGRNRRRAAEAGTWEAPPPPSPLRCSLLSACLRLFTLLRLLLTAPTSGRVVFLFLAFCLSPLPSLSFLWA